MIQINSATAHVRENVAVPVVTLLLPMAGLPPNLFIASRGVAVRVVFKKFHVRNFSEFLLTVRTF
jgi:hypothetical protein